MANTVKFVAKTPYGWSVGPKPYPATQAIPQWWKDHKPYQKTAFHETGDRLMVENYESNVTFKKCTPMLDAMASGYILPLWSDVFVRMIDENNYDVTWEEKEEPVFGYHGKDANTIPTPEGYENIVFKYNNF